MYILVGYSLFNPADEIRRIPNLFNSPYSIGDGQPNRLLDLTFSKD